jgi:hypothetical protein
MAMITPDHVVERRDERVMRSTSSKSGASSKSANRDSVYISIDRVFSISNNCLIIPHGIDRQYLFGERFQVFETRMRKVTFPDDAWDILNEVRLKSGFDEFIIGQSTV